jgi:hypothetical protein
MFCDRRYNKLKQLPASQTSIDDERQVLLYETFVQICSNGTSTKDMKWFCRVLYMALKSYQRQVVNKPLHELGNDHHTNKRTTLINMKFTPKYLLDA